MSKKIINRIGIDIGRVIIGPVIGGVADTSFLGRTVEKAMETPPAPGAFEGVAALVRLFHGQAWLVSKCGPSVQQKTKKWLRHWDFYNETGLDENKVRFCLKRPDKAIHCKQLKITHFIDDRVDVHKALRGLVPNLFLFGEQKEKAVVPEWVEPVLDWPETVDKVQESMT